jgi:hypothetical protein
MANIVPSLFGLSPEQYGEQRDIQSLNRGITLAQMDPGAAARATLYSGVDQLGRGIAGAMGIEDPQMKKMSQRNQFLQQIDLTDPQSLIATAKQAANLGDAEFAVGLIDRAKSLQESQSKLALQQAQVFKALQPNKLTGDERYISILQTIENKFLNGQEPTAAELSTANMAGQMLSKPRSYFDQASGQMITQPATDPSKAFPLTFKAMTPAGEEKPSTVPKPTIQQATAGNLPAGSQKDIAEIDASLEKISNSTQLESLSKSLKSGDVKFNAAANAFDFLGAVIPPVFGGPEVGNQVKKDEFTRAITERVNFVLNSAKGVQAKDDAQRAKDQIATPSTFYSSARMQGALDSLIRAEDSLKQELLAKKTALQSQGRTEAPNVPSAKPTEEKAIPKSTQKASGETREELISRIIKLNSDKGKTVTKEQVEQKLREVGR